MWLVALVALAATGCGGGGTLSKKAFQKQAESIQSLAAEGSLVAHDAAKGRTTTPFVRVHTQYLREAAKKIYDELARSQASGRLADRRFEGAKLAISTAELLDQLHKASADRTVAARVEAHLKDIANQAQRLAK
jgi:hypothetical protein